MSMVMTGQIVRMMMMMMMAGRTLIKGGYIYIEESLCRDPWTQWMYSTVNSPTPTTKNDYRDPGI
jgi:hypothetical protein